MRWGLFWWVTLAVVLIFARQWPSVKKKPYWDKVVFVCLTSVVWALSMLDLPHTPGPTTVLQLIFKPLEGLTKP
ncbi:hypothetical protein [Paenibacillus senegalensis]|uniref:hypothetical protein n=1 Tax=Paenibacillus senegalensis TaxID=1465766 RepID=UPI0002892EA5|nr:hypothetical protein [Paenibacillus senegalensis]